VDWSVLTRADGRKIMGCVCGVYQDYDSEWAGVVNKLWWRGVVIKKDVSEGVYSPAFVSLDSLRKEYS